jgi:DNA-directed RNA polymerase specialized sigma24 family protein
VPKLSEYVKVAEAAEILGVSLGTVRTWAADGKKLLHRETTERHTERTVTRNSAGIEED